MPVRAVEYKIRVSRYYPCVPATTPEYLLEALTPQGEVAGFLGFIEYPHSLKIGLIEVHIPYRGQGYSDALISKLLELADGRSVFTGQLSGSGRRMFQRMERQGLIKIRQVSDGSQRLLLDRP